MTVRVSAEPTEIAVGEPIRYAVTVERPESMMVEWPVPAAESVELLEQGADTSQPLGGGRVRETRWWKLTSFNVGDMTIPAPGVAYRDAAGVQHQATGQTVSVHIQSLLPQEWSSQDIRDLKPLVPVRRRITGWLLAAGALAAAAAAWWVWYRRRRATAAVLPQPPQRPAHELALEALEQLRRRGLPAQQRYEELYVALSAIIRTYVERRFRLRAPEMTTEEFLQAASSAATLSVDHRRLLDAFLAQADLVKFARYQPRPQQADEAMQTAVRFVSESAGQLALPSAGSLEGAGHVA